MKSYEYYYLAKRNVLADADRRYRVLGALRPGMKIHVSAACGKAMASITCMLANAGYTVTASDPSFYPPMSDVLRSHGIACNPPREENIRGIDLFIPGNMLPSSDVEVRAAQDADVPMMSGAEVLAALLVGTKRSLVVAGTHGKTTSSSLLTYIFQTAGRAPAYMIGGVFQDSGESYSMGLPDSTHVIFEGDEYDCAFFDKAPKFLRYVPTSAIITSIELDHIDLYPTLPDYIQAFQFLVDELPADGFLLIEEKVTSLLDFSKCKSQIVRYGASATADARYHVTGVDASGTQFSIVLAGQEYTDLKIPLFGEYNVANAAAVTTLALKEGLMVSEVRAGLASYPGVRERQEILGTTKENMIVMRDYAHHPTAVEVTLEGIRTHYPDHRLVCVFEPRSVTSRRKMFEEHYPRALIHADVSLIVTPPFKENDNRANFMDPRVIQQKLTDQQKTALIAADPSEALTVLPTLVRPGDIVVFMSNGDFGGLPQKFFTLLK